MRTLTCDELDHVHGRGAAEGYYSPTEMITAFGAGFSLGSTIGFLAGGPVVAATVGTALGTASYMYTATYNTWMLGVAVYSGIFACLFH